MSNLDDKAAENAENPPETEDRIRDGVARLLYFAVSDANKNVSEDLPGLIEKISPILHKEPQLINDAEMSALYIAYNDLSQLVCPATSESLWLKEMAEKDDRNLVLGQPIKSTYKRIRRTYWVFVAFLLLVGLLTFLAQGYVSFVSDTLETVNGLETNLKSLDNQVSAFKAGYGQKDVNPEDISPVKELLQQKQVIWLELNSEYCMLKSGKLGWLYGAFQDTIPCNVSAEPKAPAISQKPPETKDDLAKRLVNENAERNSFFAAAKATLRNFNYLLLPTLLGALGALAYVIRNILDSFKQSSFRLNSKRQWTMRVALGSALGLISGLVISPELKYFDSAKFSPLVWGFLMGYSVEFAFSLFDSLIKKGRDALAPDAPAASNSTAATLPDTPQVKALHPTQGPASGGTDIIISGSGFSREVKVNFGTAAAQAINFISDTVITATSPAGKGQAYVTVHNGKGKSAENLASQFSFLSEE